VQPMVRSEFLVRSTLATRSFLRKVWHAYHSRRTYPCLPVSKSSFRAILQVGHQLRLR
jgi:hypothetical protein